MLDCRRCGGSGEDCYDEDDRRIVDVCYHCAGSGKVDEETDYHDRLHNVASALAYQAEVEYRKACDSDPEGEGYDFRAAENMMHARDYFMARVYDRTEEIMGQLLERSSEDQDLLIAWNELPPEPCKLTFFAEGELPKMTEEQTKQLIYGFSKPEDIFGEDDIPF